ncbi:MAG: polysaccharide biosynthesis C-terminal domain-containing protein [Bacteroidota bacterium]
MVGDKWLPAVPFLQILCISGALYHLHSVNLNILKVVGRSDLFLKLEVIKKINITIAIVVGLQFGIWGLMIARVISSYAALMINLHYTRFFISYSYFEQLRDLIPVLLHTIPMILVVFAIVQILESNAIIALLLSVGLGATTYLATTIILKSQALHDIKNLLGERFQLLNKIPV